MTANDRFKKSFSAWFWGSMVLATVVHFAAVSLWPELTAQDLAMDSEEILLIELPPDPVIPPEPEAIERPAAPVESSVEIDESITIPLTTFEDNPPDRLPPPPDSILSGETSGTRFFTPFTVKPGIKNRTQVQAALIREYPPLLRDAGIGGTTIVWFQIDEEGVVVQTEVKTSSGHDALDRAALEVAGIIEFTPALNRDKRVSVWIALPITFTVR
jgi:protein TonB